MICMASTEGLVIRRTGGAVPQYQSPEAAQNGRGAPAMAVPVQQEAGQAGQALTGVSETAPQPAEIGLLGRLCSGRALLKLLACIGLDFMGDATYLIPAIGEVGDAAWAPAQAVMLQMMFNANGIALLGFVEELLPFSDALPTATIAWCLETLCPHSPISRMLGISPMYA